MAAIIADVWLGAQEDPIQGSELVLNLNGAHVLQSTGGMLQLNKIIRDVKMIKACVD
jgi:hypothetical protein